MNSVSLMAPARMGPGCNSALAQETSTALHSRNRKAQPVIGRAPRRRYRIQPQAAAEERTASVRATGGEPNCCTPANCTKFWAKAKNVRVMAMCQAKRGQRSAIQSSAAPRTEYVIRRCSRRPDSIAQKARTAARRN